MNECSNNLKEYNNIIFNGYGLGDKCEEKKFYVFAPNNTINKIKIGASSFYKRRDSNNFIETVNKIKNINLKKEIEKYNIETIDILCMDVQGYELNILKGAEEYINKIKYVIMEQPGSLCMKKLIIVTNIVYQYMIMNQHRHMKK